MQIPTTRNCDEIILAVLMSGSEPAQVMLFIMEKQEKPYEPSVLEYFVVN